MSAAANQGATLVEVIHPFDVDGLVGWMREHVPGFTGTADTLAISQFQGGQSNPTYRISHGDTSWILRRKPPGKLLPSAHAVEREYRIMQALADTDVPVPKMLGLCEDPAVIGTAFYVMDYIAGRILWEPTLPDMSEADRAAHYAEICRVIAALHKVDYTAVGLADIGKPGQYIERQTARWGKQYEAGCAVDPAGGEVKTPAPRIEAMDKLMHWLPANLPKGVTDNDETVIAHGDFRLDNLIWHPTEPRVLAVLDWELATLGHPISDFGYLMLAWRMPPSAFRGMAGIDLAALGIPDEAAFVEQYCRHTGRASIPDFDYYIIFNIFRIAAILHGVWARALAGNAADQNALVMGQRAERLAAAAWQAAQKMSSH
jgi:aminoglycoside phosphotransferase (APT) family kinase protein